MTDEAFSALIGDILDELPEKYTRRLGGVVVSYEDQPTAEQRAKSRLGDGQTLLGLYEGLPLTQRGSGFSGQLPDKITLFKLPLLAVAGEDRAALRDQVKHTLWHEIAHFYGLNHADIDDRQSKSTSQIGDLH